MPLYRVRSDVVVVRPPPAREGLRGMVPLARAAEAGGGPAALRSKVDSLGGRLGALRLGRSGAMSPRFLLRIYGRHVLHSA